MTDIKDFHFSIAMRIYKMKKDTTISSSTFGIICLVIGFFSCFGVSQQADSISCAQIARSRAMHELIDCYFLNLKIQAADEYIFRFPIYISYSKSNAPSLLFGRVLSVRYQKTDVNEDREI